MKLYSNLHLRILFWRQKKVRKRMTALQRAQILVNMRSQKHKTMPMKLREAKEFFSKFLCSCWHIWTMQFYTQPDHHGLLQQQTSRTSINSHLPLYQTWTQHFWPFILLEAFLCHTLVISITNASLSSSCTRWLQSLRSFLEVWCSYHNQRHRPGISS